MANILEETEDGKFWFNEKGQRHRDNGDPSHEYADGSKEFWVNGELHRICGPAIEGVGGYKEWWIEGDQYITEEEYNIAVEFYKVWFNSCKGK
jgi:hypothetical protein